MYVVSLTLDISVGVCHPNSAPVVHGMFVFYCTTHSVTPVFNTVAVPIPMYIRLDF